VRTLYLASASRARAELLRNAGVVFTAEAAGVDEQEMKASMRQEGANAAAAAMVLADLKARRVSARHPDALVIGADQILECNGEWFDKPADLDHARAQLRTLRGRTHSLVSGTCVFTAGSRIWTHADEAQMTMRDFSDAFLDDYLERMGNRALDVVGGYEVEGLGAQLFSRISGDHFSILGLPLLPLLEFLRGHGVVPR
jgi:septum formation protein